MHTWKYMCSCGDVCGGYRLLGVILNHSPSFAVIYLGVVFRYHGMRMEVRDNLISFHQSWELTSGHQS